MPADGPARILVEACLEDPASAVAAERAGAGSIELCGGLGDGGVTPSAGMMRAVRVRVKIPLNILIRPRAGDFIFDGPEEDVMLADIAEARRAGADGVVIGALSTGRRVHRARTERLVAAAGPMGCTFHRAFDATPDLDASMALLIELGVSRVLTSGGAATAVEGAAELARLQARWGERITIMAGGGVRSGNAAGLLRETGVREVHLGPRVAGGGRLDVAELEATIAAVRAGA
jgi:copper homeostasis protein